MSNIADFKRPSVEEIEVIRAKDGQLIMPGALYTRGQAAWFFQVSKRTLQRWEDEGVGPKVTRIGLSVYYRGESILAALEEGTK